MVKAESINMGFYLFDNYLLHKLGNIVGARDRVIVFKILFA